MKNAMKTVKPRALAGVGVRMTQRQNDTVRRFGTEGHFGTVRHFGTEIQFTTATK